MALWQANPEQSMASMYSPTKYTLGQGEGTNLFGPQKGAGRADLTGFGSYQDYLKAYKANPTQLYGSSARGIQPGRTAGFQGWDPRTMSFSSGSGYGAQTYNPYSQEQFNQATAGANIASGANLKSAYDRALSNTIGMTSAPAENELYNLYKHTVQNPNQLTDAQKWEFGQGLEAVRRTSPRLSGQRAIAATQYGQNFAGTKYGETLAQQLAAAQEERARRQSKLGEATLQANLMTRPEDQIFAQYWGTSARNRGA